MDIYLDCLSGLSGDMFLGALFDLGLDFNLFRREIKKLNLADYILQISKETRNGIAGIRFKVKVNLKNPRPRDLNAVSKLIQHSSLKTAVKKRSIAMFKRLAEAEAYVHNTKVNKIHFHELGAIDSIIDIVGSVLAIDILHISNLYVSDIVLGSGMVKTRHGIISSPAPATVALLKKYDFNLFKGNIKEELVTPTGALILTEFCKTIDDYYKFSIRDTGYGIGSKKIENLPNVLRIMSIKAKETKKLSTEAITVLETSIDDMSPQIYEYLVEKLLKAGALDVCLIPVQMKKNRPGMILKVFSPPESTLKIASLIFEETTTLGIRLQKMNRLILNREIKAVKTRYGSLRVKIAKSGKKIVNVMPEYEDCKKLALKNKIPIKKVYTEALIVVSALN